MVGRTRVKGFLRRIPGSRRKVRIKPQLRRIPRRRIRRR